VRDPKPSRAQVPRLIMEMAVDLSGMVAPHGCAPKDIRRRCRDLRGSSRSGDSAHRRRRADVKARPTPKDSDRHRTTGAAGHPASRVAPRSGVSVRCQETRACHHSVSGGQERRRSAVSPARSELRVLSCDQWMSGGPRWETLGRPALAGELRMRCDRRYLYTRLPDARNA
jgi:hypothetical protein